MLGKDYIWPNLRLSGCKSHLTAPMISAWEGGIHSSTGSFSPTARAAFRTSAGVFPLVKVLPIFWSQAIHFPPYSLGTAGVGFLLDSFVFSPFLLGMVQLPLANYFSLSLSFYFAFGVMRTRA